MHDPKVTYRSVFGIEQDPPQWKTAFEQANAGHSGELVNAFGSAWETAISLPMPHIKLEKWRWLDFSHVGLADAQVRSKPQLKLEVEFLPNVDENATQNFTVPEELVITTFGEALQRHPDLVARLLNRLTKPPAEKFQALARRWQGRVCLSTFRED